MINNLANKKFLAIIATVFAFLLCGHVARAASQLTYDADGYVIGYSLPDIIPAGNPNFENQVSYKLVEKGPDGKNGYLIMASLMEGSRMYFNMGVTDGSATNSYEVMEPSYSLFGNFNRSGDPLGKHNTIEITGTIDDPGFGTYSGVLMTADLTNVVAGDGLIGMNTGNIACPLFDFCTQDGGSAYLNLNTDLAVTTIPVTAIPLPGAVWLFGSGLLGLYGIARKKAS
jgi:hypothetical protein